MAPAARTILGGETVAYTAAGHFSDGTAQDLTAQVTWSTGDAAIAAVAAGSTARGTGVGSTPVSATWGPSRARRLSR